MEKIKEYIKCSRPHSFPASLAPVLLGSTYALFYSSSFKFGVFFLFLISCIFIQAATNLFNEYYDYKKGLDKIDSQGISGSILKNKLTEKEVINAAYFLYFISLLIGLYLTYITDYKVLILGIICMLVGYLYTGGPYPIAYSPYGEIFSGLFMGTIIVSLSFYFQLGYINYKVIAISLPMFLLIGGILLANNIRDLDNDKKSGRNTYAIIVGKNKAVLSLAYTFIVSYVLNIIYIFTNVGSIYNILVLITIPLAVKIIKGFNDNVTKETMAPYMVLTAKITIFIGFLMSLANIISYFVN